MSKRANLPVRAWKDLSLRVSKEDEAAHRTCNEFKNNIVKHVQDGIGLFIYGGVGSGKTVWTYKIARHYIESIAPKWEDRDPNPIYFANVPRLLDEFRNAMRTDSKIDELDYLIMESDIVIFDDIGAENATEWAKEKLYQYINYRYANCKTSIFTSNKELDSLEERIADRIRGTCVNVEFKMSSKRILGAHGGK